LRARHAPCLTKCSRSRPLFSIVGFFILTGLYKLKYNTEPPEDNRINTLYGFALVALVVAIAIAFLSLPAPIAFGVAAVAIVFFIGFSYALIPRPR
jgi:heme A synthase